MWRCRIFLAYVYLNIFSKLNSNDIFALAYLAAIVGKWTGLLTLPIYFIFFEQSRLQATVGKIICNLKVVRSDGKKMFFYDACLRTFLYMLISYIMFLSKKFAYSNELKPFFTELIALSEIELQIIFVPGYFLMRLLRVIWFATIIFTRNGLGIYEMISKTRVIAVKNNVRNKKANKNNICKSN